MPVMFHFARHTVSPVANSWHVGGFFEPLQKTQGPKQYPTQIASATRLGQSFCVLARLRLRSLTAVQIVQEKRV